MEYRIEALPAKKAAKGGEGFIETRDYRNAEVLAAYRYIPVSDDLGWGMVVKRDKAEVFKEFRRAELFITLFALVGIFLILGVMRLVAQNLTRPVAALSMTAQQVQNGDLRARAPVTGTDEIMELATAFNAMVERVQHWHQELDEQVQSRTTELQRKTEELENEVKAREAVQKAREQLNKILEEKNEELQQVINVTSHDLRSPLVNIHGFSSMLENLVKEVAALSDSTEIPPSVADKLRPLVTKDIPEALNFILRGASKMDRLLQGLLQFNRLGRAPLVVKPLDMDSILSDIAVSMEFQIQKSMASLEVGSLPPCLGDESQINQVFTNLIDNALKYLDPERRGIIRVSGQVENGQALYCVEDNGIGIDPSCFGKIFEMFHRLDPESAEGDGLGLTAVRRMLDRQNGSIWVESKTGEGSVFSVSLPSPAIIREENNEQ
jgi:signal transduction histidine kinase